MYQFPPLQDEGYGNDNDGDDVDGTRALEMAAEEVLQERAAAAGECAVRPGRGKCTAELVFSKWKRRRAGMARSLRC